MLLHSEDSLRPAESPWRRALFRVVFESNTTGGKAFDVALLVMIGASVITVCLDTVASFQARFGDELRFLEWAFTAVFTAEYLLRILCVRRPTHYLASFYGLVDLLAVLPSYLSLVFPGTHYLLVVRTLRLLRVFRIFKLARYLDESSTLARALLASRHKIAVFLFTVLTCTVIIGAAMYILEGEKSGFTSIPIAMYWAIVTLTTVGYGDISPVTPLGRLLASCVMILGYGIIAVPTGIVTVELSHARRGREQGPCPSCARPGHDEDARFCKHCGASLQ